MQVTHTYNTAASAYGLPGRWAKVQVLPPGGRGRRARGLTGSKPNWGGGHKVAKRAKRQDNARMGRVPHVVTTRWSNV